MLRKANGLLIKVRVSAATKCVSTDTHLVVEQYRLLDVMLGVIKVVDDRTNQPLCNANTCPTMSAAGYVFYWSNMLLLPGANT